MEKQLNRIMRISKKYVIYKLNNIMGNQQHISLELLHLNGFKSNSFETEDEAIQVLIENNRTYKNYVILRQVYITNN